MDDSERLVEAYLQSCGYNDVVFEPDGNIPPDFLVNGTIAIEVRRLNQQHDDGAGPRGLEEVAIPLWKMVETMARECGPPPNGVSWYVFITYSRPLPDRKELKGLIKGAFKTVLAMPVNARVDLQIDARLKMRFVRTPAAKPFAFVMGGRMDQQSGGFLNAEIAANLKLCIQEKARKIAKFKSRYSEWWLVLPDHIGRGLDSFEQGLMAEVLEPQHEFDRVVLVNPADPTDWFRVY